MASKYSNQYHASKKTAETKYASGEGTNAYDQTELTTVVGLPYPRSFSDNMYPMQKELKEPIESQDDNVYSGEIVSTGWESVESSREEYIQESFNFDLIIAYLALQGSLPSSYALHWQEHLHDAGTPANDTLRFESYGVFIKELEIKIPVNDGSKASFPYWVVKEGCYSTLYDDGVDSANLPNSLVKTPWLPIGANPIATQGSFTIGGEVVNGIEGALVIPCKFDEDKENGEDGLQYPYFLGFDKITFTATFRSYTEYKKFCVNVLKNVTDETRYTVKITSGLAACFPQITNMMVKEADINRIPEKGVVKYNVTFEATEDSVLSKQAS